MAQDWKIVAEEYGTCGPTEAPRWMVSGRELADAQADYQDALQVLEKLCAYTEDQVFNDPNKKFRVVWTEAYEVCREGLIIAQNNAFRRQVGRIKDKFAVIEGLDNG